MHRTTWSLIILVVVLFFEAMATESPVSLSGTPVVTTYSAYSISTTSATLSGDVNPNGLSTSYHFEWGTTPGYGTSGPTSDAGSGSSPIPVNDPEVGTFSPGTLYHFCVVATNSAGTTFGGDLIFTTLGVAPTVTTNAAYSIGTTSAVLGGTVNPNGSPTSYYFEWGTTTGYGTTGPTSGAGSGTLDVTVDEPENGAFSLNTNYHFRLVATNGNGTTYGSDQAFFTPVPVEVAFFNVTAQASHTELTWRTETETNNYGFEIERTAIGEMSQPWVQISFVKGSGTSSTPHEYAYEDQLVAVGRYAYRLKQIDRDGTFKYYTSSELEIVAPLKYNLDSNYPNPFNPSTTIGYVLPMPAHVRLVVYNTMGQIVADLVNADKEAGWNQVVWNANVASGLYFYRFEAVSVRDPNKRFVDVKKMILLK